MTEKTEIRPFDLGAARRAAYAVRLGASCDRTDVEELCRLAEQLAPGRAWLSAPGELAAARDEELEIARRREEEHVALRARIFELCEPGDGPDAVAALNAIALRARATAEDLKRADGVIGDVRAALGGDGYIVDQAKHIRSERDEARRQFGMLGDVILAEVGGRYDGGEGAVEAAIRIMRDAKRADGLNGAVLEAAEERVVSGARERANVAARERILELEAQVLSLTAQLAGGKGP